MAINPLFPHLARIYGAPASSSRPAQDADGTMASSPTSASSGDQISVSPAARDVTRAVSAARSASDLRLNKIENLKNQIAGGTYEVDVQKLASNLAGVLKP